MKRALFLDRDGIFNHLIPWGKNNELCAPRNWGELFLYPDMYQLPEIKALGYLLILVTNQPDVERGIIERRFVEDVNAFYQERYQLDAAYVCFHSENEHPLKKPNPGMFLQAAQDHSISLADSYHLGDTIRDVDAAKRCGCRSILWNRDYNLTLSADFRISSILELKSILSRPVSGER